jgi:hypothetical protein
MPLLSLLSRKRAQRVSNLIELLEEQLLPVQMPQVPASATTALQAVSYYLLKGQSAWVRA